MKASPKLLERVARALAAKAIPPMLPRQDRLRWVENNWQLRLGTARIAVREIARFVEETYARHTTPRCGYCDGGGRDKKGGPCVVCDGTGVPAIYRKTTDGIMPEAVGAAIDAELRDMGEHL